MDLRWGGQYRMGRVSSLQWTVLRLMTGVYCLQFYIKYEFDRVLERHQKGAQKFLKKNGVLGPQGSAPRPKKKRRGLRERGKWGGGVPDIHLPFESDGSGIFWMSQKIWEYRDGPGVLEGGGIIVAAFRGKQWACRGGRGNSNRGGGGEECRWGGCRWDGVRRGRSVFGSGEPL